MAVGVSGCKCPTPMGQHPWPKAAGQTSGFQEVGLPLIDAASSSAGLEGPQDSVLNSAATLRLGLMLAEMRPEGRSPGSQAGGGASAGAS